MADRSLPTHTQVAIIGGGVIGASIAYHLTQLGWKDVVVIERKKLTSGTTWHAAGLLTTLRDSDSQTKLAKYTQELYGKLEAETGQATGLIQCGSVPQMMRKVVGLVVGLCSVWPRTNALQCALSARTR